MAYNRQEGRPPKRKFSRGRPRVCIFCKDGIEHIDYKDLNRLRKFLNERSKITPKRISGNCARHQRKLSIAIKRARQMALLAYTTD